MVNCSRFEKDPDSTRDDSREGIAESEESRGVALGPALEIQKFVPHYTRAIGNCQQAGPAKHAARRSVVEMAIHS